MDANPFDKEDIRILLQNATEPSLELDTAIALALNSPPSYTPHFTTNYSFSIQYVESKGYDWIIGNVNGQIGGTPYAQVGCTKDKASFSATPLLSLWLAILRLELGDERE